MYHVRKMKLLKLLIYSTVQEYTTLYVKCGDDLKFSSTDQQQVDQRFEMCWINMNLACKFNFADPELIARSKARKEKKWPKIFKNNNRTWISTTVPE